MVQIRKYLTEWQCLIESKLMKSTKSKHKKILNSISTEKEKIFFFKINTLYGYKITQEHEGDTVYIYIYSVNK